MTSAQILWRPSASRRRQSQLAGFVDFVNERHNLSLPLAYPPLWEWSVNAPTLFWDDVWDFFAVRGDKGAGRILASATMPGAQFFPDATLNFADNLLVAADTRPALLAWNENGSAPPLSRAEVLAQTRQLAGWLRAHGVGRGDRVGAYMPNIPETVIAMLATASLGAVFSSCSIDFGSEGVIDRLGQIAPKVLIAADGYRYGGREFSRTAVIADITERIPSITAVAVVPYLHERPPLPADGCWWQDALAAAPPIESFAAVSFNAPLVILYSSGTTGAPKCIVHSVGGVLLQHLKELGLHTDIRANDKIFYFTTCGWMMWNWVVSALALQAAPVLYEGNPMYPSSSVLWQMAEQYSVAVFGASAKYFDALRKAAVKPRQTHNLAALRTLCSTGSPLLADTFSYAYADIKKDMQLASISGGTDIVSCFVLGNPFDAVRLGEIQCRGLGMSVDVYDDDGESLRGAPGELVCTAPFPSMPVMFWDDADGKKYREAYFAKFEGVWTHGDWATMTAAGGIIIHGRSDATLNPGGVRIGTAEIYRHAEAFPDIAEALAVGQDWGGDQRVILFVKMAPGAVLDDDLQKRLRLALRQKASPRHVPAKIIAVADLPRTRSGKISEIAAREVIHNRLIKNREALANPEVLVHLQNLPALQTA